MDSLPEQHIDSLPKDKREEAYRQVAIVCAYRGQELPEEEVAKKAKFGSVEDMYFRLERWGLSGLLPLGGKPQSLRKRKARQGEGKTEDLPPPADATELFREALESLSLVTNSLRHYQETYQDGRFFRTYEGKARFTASRSNFSEEEWRELCEEFGVSPDEHSFAVPSYQYKVPKGATHKPQVPLARLIAAYFLADKPVRPLVEALHPRPNEADLEAIEALIHDGDRCLLHVARNLARSVRHSRTPRGAPPPDLSPSEQLQQWEK